MKNGPTLVLLFLVRCSNKPFNMVYSNDDDDDDDDDDELVLWNGWSTKGVKPSFQSVPLSEILTISNLRHHASKIWTCAEPESGFIEGGCAVVITTTPVLAETSGW